jgi:hypothetical protein
MQPKNTCITTLSFENLWHEKNKLCTNKLEKQVVKFCVAKCCKYKSWMSISTHNNNKNAREHGMPKQTLCNNQPSMHD